MTAWCASPDATPIPAGVPLPRAARSRRAVVRTRDRSRPPWPRSCSSRAPASREVRAQPRRGAVERGPRLPRAGRRQHRLGGCSAGLPVGGSVGRDRAQRRRRGTLAVGERLLRGSWMLVILAALSGLVGEVLVPTLAGVLIFAALGLAAHAPDLAHRARARSNQSAARPHPRRSSPPSCCPSPSPSGIGVVLSLLLQLNREARRPPRRPPSPWAARRTAGGGARAGAHWRATR